MSQYFKNKNNFKFKFNKYLKFKLKHSKPFQAILILTKLASFIDFRFLYIFHLDKENFCFKIWKTVKKMKMNIAFFRFSLSKKKLNFSKFFVINIILVAIWEKFSPRWDLNIYEIKKRVEWISVKNARYSIYVLKVDIIYKFTIQARC